MIYRSENILCEHDRSNALNFRYKNAKYLYFFRFVSDMFLRRNISIILREYLNYE